MDFFKRLEPEIKLFRFQKFPENYENLTEREKEDEIQNIKNGLNFAKKVLVTEECDVLILDEILGLTDKGIVRFEELHSLIDAVGDDTIFCPVATTHHIACSHTGYVIQQ